MLQFAPNTIWQRVQATSAEALRAGWLEPIGTSGRIVEDQGVRFLVRLVARQCRKPQCHRQAYNNAQEEGPFLPFERGLHVADASPSHACVLNKYPVVEHHLLIVTRHFEHQEAPLTVNDFAALWQCLGQFPALGFYNSGLMAGASQPHKHMQLVPVPLAEQDDACPMQRLLERQPLPKHRVVQLDRVPFAHAIVSWDHEPAANSTTLAQATYQRYRDLLAAVGIRLPGSDEGRVTVPYNLLLTQRWMLVVPRQRECFQSISLNGLAFAGALLVPDEERLARLEQAGPMAALRWAAPRA